MKNQYVILKKELSHYFPDMTDDELIEMADNLINFVTELVTADPDDNADKNDKVQTSDCSKT